MNTCCFFGHRDTPDSIRTKLKSEIESLIVRQNVKKFYVGNHGKFDLMVAGVLKEVKEQFPDIEYEIVLAYLPTKKKDPLENTQPSVYPEGVEAVPKRFAIDFRNRWMLKNSNFCVAYINYSIGGAFKYFEKAQKRGLNVINLGDYS